MLPMRLKSPMPVLDGATEWLNEADFGPESVKNTPVLVYFWAVSCHICHEVMPEVATYRKEYEPLGLKMIGVHMPKQESDLDVEKVKQDIAAFNITQPVAIDNLHKMTEAFSNQFVPAFFLFDQEGKLFYRAAGDKGFQGLKPKIDQLFKLEKKA